MARLCDEYEIGAIVRKMVDGYIPGERRRERDENQSGKMHVRENMTEAGLEDDNTMNRAACRNEISSYTGDPRRRDKPGTTTNKKLICAVIRVINSMSMVPVVFLPTLSVTIRHIHHSKSSMTTDD